MRKSDSKNIKVNRRKPTSKLTVEEKKIIAKKLQEEIKKLQDLKIRKLNKLTEHERKEYEKEATAVLRRTVVIRKLSWLEAILEDNPEFEFKPAIAMYIYFVKYDKVSKIFYPNLYKAMLEFEIAVKNAQDNDPYFEIFKVMEYRKGKKSSGTDFLIESKYWINKWLDEDNISIKKISEVSGIKYANLYNYLNNSKKLGSISIKNVHRLIWIVWAIKQGWTLEEAKQKHEEKMKSLWLHWRVDVDGLEREEGEE